MDRTWSSSGSISGGTRTIREPDHGCAAGHGSTASWPVAAARRSATARAISRRRVAAGQLHRIIEASTPSVTGSSPSRAAGWPRFSPVAARRGSQPSRRDGAVGAPTAGRRPDRRHGPGTRPSAGQNGDPRPSGTRKLRSADRHASTGSLSPSLHRSLRRLRRGRAAGSSSGSALEALRAPWTCSIGASSTSLLRRARRAARPEDHSTQSSTR